MLIGLKLQLSLCSGLSQCTGCISTKDGVQKVLLQDMATRWKKKLYYRTITLSVHSCRFCLIRSEC